MDKANSGCTFALDLLWRNKIRGVPKESHGECKSTHGSKEVASTLCPPHKGTNTETSGKLLVCENHFYLIAYKIKTNMSNKSIMRKIV